MKFNIMHQVSSAIGLLAFVVLFAGCPYSSSVPVDEGTVKIAPELVGQWVGAADKESEKPTYFIIAKDDKFHATAKKMEFSSSDSSYNETIYRLTFSDVNGETFMNAKEEGNETYNIFKFVYNPKTGEITTCEVTDYIKETFKTSKELKDFVAKNKSNSYFYTNTTETYVRK